jgi:predicted ATPase
MHPRITRLYANNYRCLVNFELRPERRALLIGYNGAGKSSVLDVLHAIRSLVVFNADAKEAFPASDVTKFSGASKQRVELDVETDRGVLRYALLLAHDLEKRTVTIALEELSFDDKPAYRFVDGEVQLYGEDGTPVREPFPSSPQRSFLAAFDPKDPRAPIARFKEFIQHCWIVRLDPSHLGASAPEEAAGLDRSGANFSPFYRFLSLDRPDRMGRAYDELREIIPGFQHLRMQSSGRAKVLVATFRYPGGDAYDLDFDALSDGQKALVVLYVLLHGVARDLPVLCLDEPDNFISLREIQPFLVELDNIRDETGLQVILISHSPEVIDYVADSGAVLLERPDGGYTRARTIEAKGALRLSELMARGWLPGGSDATS